MNLAAAPTSQPPRSSADGLPGDRAATLVVASLFFLLGAVGLPISEVIQDTLKSIEVVFGALLAVLVLLWARPGAIGSELRWHPVLVLPLMLAAYAAASMLWAHGHLATVECIRWLVVALLAWLVLQLATPAHFPWLAAGVALGAVIAACWAAGQFWLGMSLFPQGRHPASTFGNRNFLSEYLVMALPFCVALLARARTTRAVLLRTAGCAMLVLALMMTGTRSALVALTVQLVVLFPLVLWLWWQRVALVQWTVRQRALAGGLFAALVLGLGSVPTNNASIMEDMAWQKVTPLERALLRSETFSDISSRDQSENPLGVRMLMWRDTVKMIAAHPVTGVGAGSWEVQMPRFMDNAARELDFFAHNEYLQFAAEYGLVGWVFLLGMAGGLLATGWRLVQRSRADASGCDTAFALTSLFALLVVSLAGFPLHMASTGALLALALGLVAPLAPGTLRTWKLTVPARLGWTAAIALALAAALVVSVQGVTAEWKINAAASLARGITATGDPRNPRLAPQRAEAVRLITEGMAINPHNRRVAAPVGDEFARWGDWENATRVWEQTATSRPYVVVILTNVARGHLRGGRPAQAREFLERARAVQPRENYVRAVDVMVTGEMGEPAKALKLAREALDDGVVDYDMFNYAYSLAMKLEDPAIAARAMAARLKRWPQEDPATAWLQLAEARQRQGDAEAVLDAYRAALAQATPAQRPAVAGRVPAALRSKLGL